MPEKTAAQKLLLKAGKTVRFYAAPPNLEALLGGIPEGVEILGDSSQKAECILAFVKNRQGLEACLDGLKSDLAPGGALWIAYFKGTSKFKTDIHRDSINAYAKTLGMAGIAMISIDQDWSALRLKIPN